MARYQLFAGFSSGTGEMVKIELFTNTTSKGTPRLIARGDQTGTFSKMKGKEQSDGVMSTK